MHHAKDWIGVAIGIPPDSINRHLNCRVILANRPMLIERIAPLVPHPVQKPQPIILQPLHPHVAPPCTHDLRVRWRVANRKGRRPPGQLVSEHRATHEMDVIGITVIGRTQRDDRAKRLRLARRDLQTVEAAPADPDHPHFSRAPTLRRQPIDHRQGIVLLLQQVLAEADAFAVTRTAHINPNPGVTVPSEIGMGQVIALHRPVTFAIRQVFKDRRYRIVLGILRQPNPRSQPGAIGHGNPRIVDLAHLARKFGFDGNRLHHMPFLGIAYVFSREKTSSSPDQQVTREVR